MAKDLKFINSLGLSLTSKAEQQIQSNLLCEFYDQLDQDDDLLGDRKFASMSDIKEVRDAFNKFYNLTSTDEEYLN
jgi:phosphomannomutase